MSKLGPEEAINGDFAGRDILSVNQFSRPDVEMLFGVASNMGRMVEERGRIDILKGTILATLFYEASTRTSSSFIAAMQRLGGGIIPITGVQYSSVSKGETLEDTVATLGCYADVIAIRHPEVGAASKAAAATEVPVINAGDGVGEHPTQALLDLFTIQAELGTLDNLSIAMLGDLKNGRTVHSLARLSAKFGASLSYVAPADLSMPRELMDELDQLGIDQNSYESLDPVIESCDVLYVTRIQKERFEDAEEYERLKDSFIITPEVMRRAKPKMVLHHPLPRVNEIAVSVDSDPRAAYFRGMRYGLNVRMGMLPLVIGRSVDDIGIYAA